MNDSSTIFELSAKLSRELSPFANPTIQYPIDGYILRETAQEIDPDSSKEEIEQTLRDLLGIPASLDSYLIEVAVKTQDSVQVDPFSEIVDLIEVMMNIFLPVTDSTTESKDEELENSFISARANTRPTKIQPQSKRRVA